MSILVDYSTSRPSVQILKAAGVTAVGRYIGWDSVSGFPSIGKNLTKPEAESLISDDIDIFLSFEYQADAAANGWAQGIKDGNLAMQQLAELGAPPGMAVYFAVDFDIPDYAPSLPDTVHNALAKLGPVGAYFQAINSLKHPFEVGAYGSYYAIKRLLDSLLITKAWQTTAWSGGQVDNRVNLYQVTLTAPVTGADIDLRENAATQPDFGSWLSHVNQPTTPIQPTTPTQPSPPPTQPTAPDPPVHPQKENDVLHIKVTAPTSGVTPEPSWAGKTRTFLYVPGTPPVHIVDVETETAVQAALPAVEFTWSMYTSVGGS